AMFGTNPAIENLEAMTRSNMEIFSKAMSMFTPFAAAGGAAAKAKEEPAADNRAEELSSLKEQLAEMQSQLDKLARKS
ncbi:MAG: polyhydroxyalkanoate synthesis repressor PhaR, partial [Pseudomonadota bacterium]